MATGFIQLVVTRYISDQLYMRKTNNITPTFLGAMALVVPAQTAIASIFLFLTDLTLFYKITALGLYTTVSVIWIEMIFLGAAKDYARIVSYFAVGYLASFIGAHIFGWLFLLDGFLFGFLVGQLVLCTLLMNRIFTEYKMERGFNFLFAEYYSKYKSLAFIGFLFNTAIWIDKIIFWFSPSGLNIHSNFYTHFPYDSSMFIAFLTIVPSVAIFLLRIETDFYTKYKSYYGAILQKADYETILRKKNDMISILRNSLMTVIIYQGSFSIGVMILMPFIISILGIDPVNVPLFRVACGGAFFHILLFVLFILFLYFDFRGSALFLSSVYLATNSIFTVASVYAGESTHGLGYLFACVVTFVIGITLFIDRIRNLEYLTFMRQ